MINGIFGKNISSLSTRVEYEWLTCMNLQACYKFLRGDASLDKFFLENFYKFLSVNVKLSSTSPNNHLAKRLLQS